MNQLSDLPAQASMPEAAAGVVQHPKKLNRSFFRGDTINRMPRRADMLKANAIQDHILFGWMAPEPFIDRSTNIVAFGSCFAANIGKYLSNIGFDVSTQREGSAYVQRISDGLVNVFAIQQQFEWAWENHVPKVELWHGWDAEKFGYDPEIQRATKELFDAADLFILTFGLSEIWYDEPTGEVFWRAVPEDKFDPARHKFRLATFDESVGCLRRIYALIRKHRPNAKIVITLSPIGLAATFRPISCITANAVSKAILRTAIDCFYREVHETDPGVYYFPSYEVVTYGFQQPYESDLRHVHSHVLRCNMKAFERYFCKTGMTDEELHHVIREALELDDLMLGADDAERAAIAISYQPTKMRQEKRQSDKATVRSINAERKAVRKKFLEDNQPRIDSRRAQRVERIAAKRAKKVEAKALKKAARQALREQPSNEQLSNDNLPLIEDKQARRANRIAAKLAKKVEQKAQKAADKAERKRAKLASRASRGR